MEEITITLSSHQYRLLQSAISAAQIHPSASDNYKDAWAALGWEIHNQIEKQKKRS